MPLTETQKKYSSDMQTRQTIENTSIVFTGETIGQKKNRLIRQVHEILLNDSRTHHMVQEYMHSGFRHRAGPLATDELAALSDGMEKHNELVKKMMGFVEDLIFLER
jgi:hypothetical protein